MVSLTAIKDLNAHLPAIAEENQINPVRDYLAALEWDGEDRIGRLVRAMEPHDTEVAEIALRVWFTGAAAACEHFETGLGLVNGARPSFEYVLAILGDQGVNKTKGFPWFSSEGSRQICQGWSFNQDRQ